MPQKCAFGSMVPLLSDHSVIALVSCFYMDGDVESVSGIYQLSWDYGGNLAWHTMTQKVKYQRYNAVAMAIPDEWTNCTIT